MALKADHYVRTPDRRVCLVTYVSEGGGEAALLPLDGGERLTLPIAELKRVPNPTNKRPRVEGVPRERPRCAWCNRPLRPNVRNHYSEERQIWKRVIVRREFDGWRSYEDAFDRKDCAVAFAGASWRAGFRRMRRN